MAQLLQGACHGKTCSISKEKREVLHSMVAVGAEIRIVGVVRISAWPAFSFPGPPQQFETRSKVHAGCEAGKVVVRISASIPVIACKTLSRGLVTLGTCSALPGESGCNGTGLAARRIVEGLGGGGVWPRIGGRG